jgi:hypothetical protein
VTAAPTTTSGSFLDSAQVRATTPRYHRAGVNLASDVLELLRRPDVIGRAPRTPYRQLAVLLDLVKDTRFVRDDIGDRRASWRPETTACTSRRG